MDVSAPEDTISRSPAVPARAEPSRPMPTTNRRLPQRCLAGARGRPGCRQAATARSPVCGPTISSSAKTANRSRFAILPARTCPSTSCFCWTSAPACGRMSSAWPTRLTALRVLADKDRVGIMVFDTYTRVRLSFRSNRSEINRGSLRRFERGAFQRRHPYHLRDDECRGLCAARGPAGSAASDHHPDRRRQPGSAR